MTDAPRRPLAIGMDFSAGPDLSALLVSRRTGKAEAMAEMVAHFLA